MEQDDFGDSVLRNDVDGLIEVISYGLTGTGSVSVIRGNKATGIKLSAAGLLYHNDNYIEAEVDSNEVNGGDGISVFVGDYYCNNYGTVNGSVTRNEITGIGSGTGLKLNIWRYSNAWSGEINMFSSYNEIINYRTGIYSYGQNVDFSSDGDVVTECETGVDAQYGELLLENCTLVGVPICDCAVTATNMDSIRVEMSSITDWVSGISLSSCAWSKVRLNELNGRQDGYGIMCSASSPLIQDNYIDRFLTAIHAESGTTPTITNNSLACATNWGVYNMSINDTIVAEDNWWGDEDGPQHASNPLPRSFPYTWAMLLARIYESLPLVCPRCGSAMRVIAFITNASDVKRILEHIGEASEPPPVSPSRAPPEEAFEFDQRTEWDDDTEV